MKKVLIILAIMATVLSSCSKSNYETAGKRVDAPLKLNVTVSNPCVQTKALIKEEWEQNDKIKIWYDTNTGATPDLVIEYDGSKWAIVGNATVSGSSPSTGSGQYLKAIFEDKVAVAAKDAYTYTEDGVLTFNLHTWTFLTEIQVVVSGYSVSAYDFTPTRLHLSCSGFKPYNGYTVGAEAITAKDGAKGSAATCCSNVGNDFYFVYATADYSSTATAHLFTFKDDYSVSQPREYAVSKAITKPESGIKAIKIACEKFKQFPQNALKGLFSVRDGETAPIKYIHFSKANLKATWDGTKYNWYFADNQKSVIGNNPGNTSIDSPVADKSVDLFCWSTTAANSNWGIHTGTTDEYIGGTFNEWGQQIDDKGTWRTLTAGEWEYLLERENAEGKPLFQVTHINYIAEGESDSGDYGLILYPDNYSGSVTDSNYTATQWSTMESAGCVFLPATGLRQGSEVGYSNTGYYWSSTVDEGPTPYHMSFGSGGAKVSNFSTDPSVIRGSGCAVRLITEVK